MSQGNPNKVNAIVDEIVENNNLFKLKSPIEQDKAKYSIAKSINSAISILNDVGKELVLQELSIDPDEKFKGFIDNVGNVDIFGFTQMTATIVKSKIEEAEREGINLRKDSPNTFKDNKKTLITNGILTLAVVDNMIKNYDNLTYEDKKDLWDNFLNFPKEQQRAIVDADKRKLEKIIKSEQSTDEQKKEAAEIIKGYDEASKIEQSLNSNNPQERRKAISKLKANQEAVDLYVSIKKQDNPNFSIEQIDDNDPKEWLKINDYSISIWGQRSVKFFDRNLSQDKAQNSSLVYKYKHFNRGKDKSESNASVEIQGQVNSNMQEQNETIAQEVEQLPSALVKANFLPEEIKEGLEQYIQMIQAIPITEYEDMHNSEQIIEYFKGGLEPPKSKSDEILEILVEKDFDGNLYNYLTNPKLLQEIFLPALNKELEKLEQQPIKDEHTDEYYRSQNETLKVDDDVEKVAKEVQSQGGSLEEITEALVRETKEHVNEQTQQSIAEEQPKEPKVAEQISTVTETKTTPEEHTQESITSPELENIEETSQNMAMVEQDNSIIGRIRRVFVNMKDMKNKDASKGFFTRLIASVKNEFGNKKEEYYEEQDKISASITTKDKSQPTINSQQIDYFNQHFEVNTQEAIRKTEESRNEGNNRTQDEEQK